MVETFQNLEPYPSILRVETTQKNTSKKLPPFVTPIREVTGEKEYETWFMADQDWKMPNEDQEMISQKLLDQRKQH